MSLSRLFAAVAAGFSWIRLATRAIVEKRVAEGVAAAPPVIERLVLKLDHGVVRQVDVEQASGPQGDPGRAESTRS